MTQNQINYWKLQEEKRANAERERIQWDERKAENFLVPYKAAQMEMDVYAKHSTRVKDVSQGILNIVKAATGLGIFG